MFRSRIFLKLYAGYVVIILFSTTILSLMIARQMSQDYLADIDNNLKNQAMILRQSIRPDLLTTQADVLQQRILQMAQNIDSRITVIAIDGIVLADSEQDPASMDNHSNRPELKQADENGLGLVSRYSQTLSISMRYLALPIIDNNQKAYVRVSLPLSIIDQRLERLRNVVIVAASVTAIIALLIGFWIARSFAYPLRKMKRMAQILSAGDYQQRLEINRQDEIGELANALNKLAQTAAQREAVRRDFVANASHELKTPATAIHGLAETLLDDDEMDDQTRQRFLKKIHEQSLSLSQLVSDLLALSRLESDGSKDFSLIDLKEIIADSCNTLQSEATAKNITFEIQLPDYEVMINGNEKSMLQMIDNLLDNAIKYTPIDGNITVNLSTKEKQAIIKIKDDGLGIDPSEQNRIFERFYRVDKAHSRKLGGTGLGLSIVKHIVNIHQGHIDVESALGHGSVFQVTLPLS